MNDNLFFGCFFCERKKIGLLDIANHLICRPCLAKELKKAIGQKEKQLQERYKHHADLFEIWKEERK